MWDEPAVEENISTQNKHWRDDLYWTTSLTDHNLPFAFSGSGHFICRAHLRMRHSTDHKDDESWAAAVLGGRSVLVPVSKPCTAVIRFKNDLNVCIDIWQSYSITDPSYIQCVVPVPDSRLCGGDGGGVRQERPLLPVTLVINHILHSREDENENTIIPVWQQTYSVLSDLHHIFKDGHPPGELIRGLCTFFLIGQTLTGVSTLKTRQRIDEMLQRTQIKSAEMCEFLWYREIILLQ